MLGKPRQINWIDGTIGDFSATSMTRPPHKPDMHPAKRRFGLTENGLSVTSRTCARDSKNRNNL
jgi:hypothetical protein